MPPLLRRIVVHGALAAVILAVLGRMFAEVASIWLAGSPAPPPGGARIQVKVDSADVSDQLKVQVPLRMALLGLAMVVVGETLLHFWRNRKPLAAPAISQPQPDEGEKLLELLLTQAESRAGDQQPDRPEFASGAGKATQPAPRSELQSQTNP